MKAPRSKSSSDNGPKTYLDKEKELIKAIV